MEKLKLAVIGLGQRGTSLLEHAILHMKDIECVAVCDTYQDRVDKLKNLIYKKTKVNAKGYLDYKELLDNEKLDCVIVSCSWNKHSEIAMYAMEKGVAVGAEVSGAYSLDECYELINTYEKTKTPFMLLENCCYGEYELCILNMVKKGLFGKVVSMEGGYRHDLREEVCFGNVNRHYRLNEYLTRCCDNYPTHEIGPIAKVLNINNGNRFTKLTSFASSYSTLSEYVLEKSKQTDKLDDIKGKEFKQADIVHTIINCENGEIVRITLDTSLPRPYSRSFTCQGTKAMYQEDGNYFFFDNNKIHHAREFATNKFYNNGKFYAWKYRHPIWKWFKKRGVKGGHGGMDWLVLRAFFESVKNGEKMPIDVYDAATFMAVTILSEQSIKNGSVSVDFPDFTNGKYKEKKQSKGFFALD